MNHSITVEQFGVKLRPVTRSDSDYIYTLRRDPELSKFIGDIDENRSVHEVWLEQYFGREHDYYFCIETEDGERVGIISIYNVEDGKAEWGRWVIVSGVPAAPASAWLIYHVGFDILRLSHIYCRTLKDNAHVLSFHDSCGLSRGEIQYDALTIRGQLKDVVVHSADSRQWNAISEKLRRPAALAERLLKGGR